jgi:hypothetical protein
VQELLHIELPAFGKSPRTIIETRIASKPLKKDPEIAAPRDYFDARK